MPAPPTGVLHHGYRTSAPIARTHEDLAPPHPAVPPPAVAAIGQSKHKGGQDALIDGRHARRGRHLRRIALRERARFVAVLAAGAQGPCAHQLLPPRPCIFGVA